MEEPSQAAQTGISSSKSPPLLADGGGCPQLAGQRRKPLLRGLNAFARCGQARAAVLQRTGLVSSLAMESIQPRTSRPALPNLFAVGDRLA